MDTHELPEDLNPSGDACYPIFIPNDSHWRQLVIGALSQLTNPDYYRQNAFAPNDVISVCETWHERMLVPFVQSMNDNAGCESGAMTITNLGLQRTSNVSTSTFPYVVPFEVGSGYDSGNPTRLTPSEGNVVIQANVHFTAGSANVGYVEIRKNTGIGTLVLARHDLSGVTTNYVNLSAIDVADSDDFYELVIQSNVPITIQTGTFFPKLECKVFA